MAISKIKLPDNSVQDIHDARGVDTNGSFYFVQGSSSAAGSSTSGSYLSVKWEGTVPGVSAAYNGLKIAYRIATRTGVSGGGVVLSIDNGAHYYPVVIQANSMVTTHYPVGATFLAVFNSTQTATAYLTAGTKSTVTGCWQIMEYDSNTNTYQREYVSSNNVEYPITTRYDTTTGSSYYAEYGRYSENVTLNPSTNKITAAGFKVTNGTSSQFLKADGSVDSTSYGTYSKPSGGIPASDLASGVIPTTLPASDVYAWAKASTKPSYTASEVGALPDTTVIPTVPTISTNVASDKTSDTKTSSPKSVYDEIHPAIVTTQPSGGFKPNIMYNLGTLTGTVTFAMAEPIIGIVNHYYWTFSTGSTAPTITWPAGITAWNGNVSAPIIAANSFYEISVCNGIGCYMVI